jgi:hypothetical protein
MSSISPVVRKRVCSHDCAQLAHNKEQLLQQGSNAVVQDGLHRVVGTVYAFCHALQSNLSERD